MFIVWPKTIYIFYILIKKENNYNIINKFKRFEINYIERKYYFMRFITKSATT